MHEQHNSHVDGTGDSPSRDETGGWDGAITRRAALLATGTAATVALAGCLGGDGGGAPAAVAIQADWSCDKCGMVITNHPGPNAEVFYADEQPNDHDNPARFCSTWEAFQYDFEKAEAGWAREAFYVTDYSAVDYEVFEERGDTLITSHAGADTFADATGVTFVVASAVKGAMGKDLVGFTDSGDAEDFAAEYGGDVVPFDEVTRDTVAGLGM